MTEPKLVFYRSMVGRQAQIRRNGEQVTLCSFSDTLGYTVGFDDGSIDYFYSPEELCLPESPFTHAEARANRLLRFWHRKRTGGNRCPGSGGREFMKATGGYGCRRAVLRDGTGLCGKCSGRDERIYAVRP